MRASGAATSGPGCARCGTGPAAEGLPPHRMADRIAEERLAEAPRREEPMKATVAGTTLDYDVRGDGPAVLFLHAFPLEPGHVGRAGEGAAPSHQVDPVRRRGFGGTPPGDGLLTMERIADDAAALLDHLGLSQATFVGLSMGGYAAFALVRRHAPRIKALVLADTRVAPDSESRSAALRPGGHGAARGPVRHRGRLPAEGGRRHHARGAAGGRGAGEGDDPGRARARHGGRAGRACGPRGLEATLREIKVPTLVVCGAEDALTPPADAKVIHEGVPGSTLEILARAGHLSALEDPAAFNAVLLAFLKSR